ncbi:hypothetical protein ABZW10_35805 [Kitasatospora sp. NPDC004723]|uniref:hypothetical protein n=1 Tax=Kitasatospora sp. NPDC004723 TaxID=3154288 RepID=UPI0033A77587
MTDATAYGQAQQRSARVPSRCSVPWGVCPEHGATLASSAGRTWCMDPSCLKAWPYDRMGAACLEPATHTVQASDGGRYIVCDGHARAARIHVVGGHVDPGLPNAS